MRTFVSAKVQVRLGLEDVPVSVLILRSEAIFTLEAGTVEVGHVCQSTPKVESTNVQHVFDVLPSVGGGDCGPASELEATSEPPAGFAWKPTNPQPVNGKSQARRMSGTIRQKMTAVATSG
jgi:hypothetical protein